MKPKTSWFWTTAAVGLLLGIALLANAQSERAPEKSKVAFKWLAVGKHVYIEDMRRNEPVNVQVSVLEGEREKRLLTPHPEYGISTAVYLITDVGDNYVALQPLNTKRNDPVERGTRKVVLREVVLPLASIALVRVEDDVPKPVEIEKPASNP